MNTSVNNLCRSLSCEGLCIRSPEKAECLCSGDLHSSCQVLSGQQSPPPRDGGESDQVAKTKTNKRSAGTVALAVILAFAGVALLSLLYYKCKRPTKSPDVSLS